MADQFAGFQDRYPVVEEQSVESNAKGKAALSEVFGNIENKVVDVAVNLKKEQKDALILSSQDSLIKLKSQSQIQIAQNPGMADAVLNNFKQNSVNILSGLPQSSRGKFQLLLDQAQGQLGIAAAKEDHKQYVMRAGVALDNAFPGSLDAIKQAQDPKIKEQLTQSLTNTLTHAAMGGVIHQGAYSKYMKQVHDMLDRDQDMQDLAVKGGATAAQAQSLYAISPTNSALVQPNSPMDLNTKFVIDHYDNEQTLNSALKDASTGVYPNPAILSKLHDHQYSTVKAVYMGALTEQGKWAANNHQAELETDYQQLKTQKFLSDTDKGKLAWLQKHFEDQNNGDTYEQITNTAAGATILNDFNHQIAAINSSVYDNNGDKQQAVDNAMNDKRSKIVSTARAQGIPIDKVNVLNPTEINYVNDAFKKDADVAPLLSTLYQTKDNLNYFVAKAAAKPEQKSALFIAGLQKNLSPNNPPTNFQTDLLAANQTNKDYSQLKPGDSQEKITRLGLQIYANLKPQMQFMALQPEGDANTGGEWANGTVKSLTNYVKFKALQAGDFDLNHLNDYIDDAVSNVQKSYKMTSGLNYDFNLNEVPQLTNESAEYLTNYLVDQQYQEAVKRYGDAKATSAMDIFALHAVNSRDGQIALVDPTGHVVYHSPITQALLSKAKLDAIKNSKEIQKAIEDQKVPDTFHTPGPFGEF